jgi:DNA-binding MarR family transcriptional regulator
MSSLDSDPRAVAWRRLLPRAVLYHEAIADRFGVNPTDLKCLELLAGESAMSPSRLAELSGLTTGAVTGVLDRLERAGIVQRSPDPGDRRRVTVLIRPERTAELAALYAPFVTAAAEEAAGTSAGPLSGVIALLEAETARLRAAVRGGMVGDTFVAPTGGATRGRLSYSSGAARLAVHKVALGQQARMVLETSATRLRLVGPTDGDELVRARFIGPIPDVRAADGNVAVRYPKRTIDFRSKEAQLRLEPAISWSIEIDGGLTNLDGDLRRIRLLSLELRGGANHIRLRLPRPEGTARIMLDGGASEVRIERPAGTAVAIALRGAVSHLRFDGRRSAGADAGATFRSEGYASAADRIEVELSAASLVTIGVASR